MTWLPSDHTGEENLRWSLLRAMEWGQWRGDRPRNVGDSKSLLFNHFIRYRAADAEAIIARPRN